VQVVFHLLFLYLETTSVWLVGSNNRTHCGFMVTTRSQHYRSSSPASSQGRFSDLLDVEPVIALDKAFKPISAWGTATRSHVHWVGFFDEMEEETRGSIRDRFSSRARTISLQDWKIRFRRSRRRYKHELMR
jgi:hypothetical protein